MRVSRGSDFITALPQACKMNLHLNPSWITTMILNWEEWRATSQISAHISSGPDLSNVCIHSQVKDLRNSNISELISTFISLHVNICVCFLSEFDHKPHTLSSHSQTLSSSHTFSLNERNTDRSHWFLASWFLATFSDFICWRDTSRFPLHLCWFVDPSFRSPSLEWLSGSSCVSPPTADWTDSSKVVRSANESFFWVDSFWRFGGTTGASFEGGFGNNWF